MAQLLMRRPHLLDLPVVPPLPEGYSLRLAGGEADVEALADTLARAFEEPWDAARVRRELTAAPDVRAVYVATWRDRVVATAASRALPERFPGSGYVHWVGTHPAHRRRGLGTALLAQVLHDFAERGDRDAVLETDDPRLPAVRAYLACGFLPVYEVAGEDHRARWSSLFQAIWGGR